MSMLEEYRKNKTGGTAPAANYSTTNNQVDRVAYANATKGSMLDEYAQIKSQKKQQQRAAEEASHAARLDAMKQGVSQMIASKPKVIADAPKIDASRVNEWDITSPFGTRVGDTIAAGYNRAQADYAGTAQVMNMLDKDSDRLQRQKENYEQQLQQAIARRDEAQDKKLRDAYQERINFLQSQIDTRSQQVADKGYDAKIEKYKDAADRYEEKSNQYTERAMDGLGVIGQTLVKAGISGTQMALDSAPSVALGLAGIQAPANLGLGLMGTRVFGSSAREELAKGGDLNSAIQHGVADAAIEIVSEKMFDGLAGIYGGGAWDDVVDKAITKLAKSDNGRKALSVLFSMGEEGLEEVFSGIVGPMVSNAIDGKSIASAFNSDMLADVVEGFTVGALLGGWGGVTSIATGHTNFNEAPDATAQFNQPTLADDAAWQNYEQAIQESGLRDTAAWKMNAQQLGAQGIGRYAGIPAKQEQRTINRDTIRSIADDPQQLADLGIETAGKSPSEVRAEIRARLEQENENIASENAKIDAQIAERDQAANDTAKARTAENAELSAVPQAQAVRSEDAPASSTTNAEPNAVQPATEATKSETIEATQPVSLQEESKKYGKQAEAFERVYNLGWKGDVSDFSKQFRFVMDAAEADSIPLPVLKTLDAVQKSMTAQQIEMAYEIGKGKQSADTKARLDANAKETAKQAKRGRGVVGKTNSWKYDDLNQVQKRAVSILRRIAEATGVNIVLYRSTANAEGEFTADNGKFVQSENTIYIDINAGLESMDDVNDMAKYTMLRAFGHEFTHFVEKWSPKEYNALRKAVFNEMIRNGNNPDALIQWKLDQYRQQVNPNFSYEQASREVVADALADILPQSRFIENLYKEHRTLARKMATKLHDFVDDIKRAFGRGNMATDSGPDVQFLTGVQRGALHYAQGIVDLFDAAAKSSVEAYQAANGIEMGEMSGDSVEKVLKDAETKGASTMTAEDISAVKDTSGDSIFQLRTMKEDKDLLIQDLVDAGIAGEGKAISIDELNELSDNINKVMDFVEKHLEEIESSENFRNMGRENRPFLPYKDNADPHYKKALDFSTLCRKRLLTQAITEKLQAQLKRALTPVEQVKIRNEIKELQKQGKQLDVACALCYVEAARLKTPKVINEFLNHKGDSLKAYYSLQNGRFKKEVYEKRRGDWKEARGLDRKATKDQIKAAGYNVNEFNKFSLDLRKNYWSWLEQADPKEFARENAVIELAENMDNQEYLSAVSLAKLRQSQPDLYEAFITKVRQAARSKAQETDVPYARGDINEIGDALIEQMNEESGFRHQSWSDFQAMHMLDTISAIIELSTKKAKAHTYTKVPNMVRFLGNTGMAINMSLIPAGDTGLDANGNLIWDDVEGIPYEDMSNLRKQFSRTAGNIAIGISDEQIRAMMASPDIDYIIPYHTSGLNADMRKRMGIKAWKNYTASQNEKGGTGPALREWFNEVDAVSAADGNAYMREASKKYLQLCHERGLVPKFSQFLTKNSDGSYSLESEDQNYWKLLIDRKMVDQLTNSVIIQQAVLPKFNLDTMLDILDNEVNSQAAKDAREAEAYIVDKLLNNPGVFTKEELNQAKILRDAALRVMIENSADSVDTGDVQHSIRVKSTDTYTLPSGETVNTLDYLNSLNEEGVDFIYTYKSMSYWGKDKDGNAILRSPMAEFTDRNKNSLSSAYIVSKDKSKPFWYQAEEDPTKLVIKVKEDGKKTPSYIPLEGNEHLVAPDWSNLYYPLIKKNELTGALENPTYARYNPYEHSSNKAINDQFDAGYRRPNLVTVKMKVPLSEAAAQYRADYSKDPTGWTGWKSGKVAGKISAQKADWSRDVYLSRYAAPVEIMPNSWVAQQYKDYLDGTDVEVPDAVVSADLLSELKKAGVPIKETGKLKALEKAKPASYAELERLMSDLKAEQDGDVQHSIRVKPSDVHILPNGERVNALDWLNNQKYITVYKAVQKVGDGEYIPPMAGKVKDENGKYVRQEVRKRGEWFKAVENKDSITEFKTDEEHGTYGVFTLKKDDGGTDVKAAYDPYEHSSNYVINDQFEGASERDNIVVVECQIPVEDLNSGYRAEYSYLPVGEHDWKTGIVGSQLAAQGKVRKTYMTRYLRVVRELSDAEVASKYKELVGNDVPVPFNVVTKGLLSELESAGVNIDYNGSPMYQAQQYRNAVKAGDMGTAQKYVDIAAERRGYRKSGNVFVNEYGYEASAEPTVYDKDGKLLSLSDRFKEGKKPNGYKKSRKAGKALRDGVQYQLRADSGIEGDNIKSGNAAIEKLIEDSETADDASKLLVPNAMYRSDIGYIDFKWGVPGRGPKFKGGYGLSHIIAKRNAENGSGAETAYKLVDVIAKATTADAQSNDHAPAGFTRLRMHHDGYTAILAKAPGENHWLLTGWENNKEATAFAVGEVNDSSNATAARPTRTRSDGVDAIASDMIVPHSDSESQEGISDQRQLRRSSLSNLDVLRAAANMARDDMAMTEPEKAVWGIFRARLNKLEKSEAVRKDLLEQKRNILQGREAKNLSEEERKELRKVMNNLDTVNGQIRRHRDGLMQVESAKVMRGILERARDVVERDVTERNNERLEEYKLSRDERDMVRKYKKQIEETAGDLSRWLQVNSDKEHVPEILKQPLTELLTSIDFSSKRSLKGGEPTKADKKFASNITKLKSLLEGQRGAIEGEERAEDRIGAYIDLSEESREALNELVDAIAAFDGTYTINEMTGEQLKQFSKLLKNIRASIRQANALLGNARYKNLEELANDTYRYLHPMGAAGGLQQDDLANFVTWKNATPYYAFKRFGKAGEALFDGFARGWEKFAFNVKQIIDFTKSAYNPEEVKAWKSEIHDIELQDGSKFKMTTAQIMALSQLLNREQARKHIFKGGVRIGVIEQKGLKHNIDQVEHYHFSDADLQNILSLLTDRQRDVARRLQGYMAQQGEKWGNEISMSRFGYNFYTEGPMYYPIKTDDTGRPMADRDQNDSMFRLLNLSASKSLNPHASNALVVDDIFDTFADHMSDMAKLNALGLPLLDAIKWFNYTSRVEVGNDGEAFTREGVKKWLETAYGKSAGQYFRTLIKDINAPERGADRTKTGWQNWFISNYKVAAVAANLRVALLQPTSYVRASAIISPKNLANALQFSKGSTKKALEEALQYSGTALWKDLGYFDTNIAQSLRDQIEHTGTVMDDIKEKSMLPAEKGDQLTWARLWIAAKMEAKERVPSAEGKALNELAANIFRETIYATQVMDSTLTRSTLMRGTSLMDKLATAFGAEPTLSFNLLMDAASSFARDARITNKAEAWKQNSGKIYQAASVYAVSAATAALVESFMDALRDDDDYETLFQKFLQALFGEDSFLDGNLAQDLTIVGKIPVIKDMVDTIRNKNSDKQMHIAAVSNMVNAFAIWKETIDLATGKLEKATSTTWNGKMTNWGKIYKTLQALSQATGMPVSNTLRDAIAAWNSTAGAFAPSLKVKTYDPGERNSVKYAYQDGLISEEKAIDYLMRDAGLSMEDAKKAVGAWQFDKASDQSGSISEAAAERYYEYAEDAGISETEFYGWWKEMNGMSGEDLDGDGKNDTNTKLDKRLAFINSLHLSSAQKTALAKAYGISDKNISKRAPW